MGYLFIAVILGAITGQIADRKGKSFFLWFLYGTALAIVALPHAIIMRPEQSALDQDALERGNKKCPYCAEIIRGEATVCRFCGRDLE